VVQDINSEAILFIIPPVILWLTLCGLKPTRKA